MIRAGVIALLSLSLAACSGAEDLSPPEARLGFDSCARCGMMLADARFVGALVFRDDAGAVQRRIYDDVGEMLAVDPPIGEHIFYVLPFDSGAWIPAEQAIFIHSRSVLTPMATGVVAFEDHTSGEAFAAAHEGVPLTFNEARERAANAQFGVNSEARAP